MVTLDDKPIKKGQVTFHPSAGGPLAYGEISADGSYRLRTAGSQGVIPGNYTATVVAFTQDPWDDITAEEVEQIRLIPRRYSDPTATDKKFAIDQGDNRCDMRLQSR